MISRYLHKVARATVLAFSRTIPPAVPGVVFLSGGQVSIVIIIIITTIITINIIMIIATIIPTSDILIVIMIVMMISFSS